MITLKITLRVWEAFHDHVEECVRANVTKSHTVIFNVIMEWPPSSGGEHKGDGDGMGQG